MKMTNEQIENMLRGLASFNTHYDNMKKEAFHLYGANDDATIHALPDLREILALRQRVQELETQVRSIALSRNELAATVERLKSQQSEVAARAVEGFASELKERAKLIPLGAESKSKGAATYNWQMFYAEVAENYANQLRERGHV